MVGAKDLKTDFEGLEELFPEVTKESEDGQVSAQVPCPRIHKGLPFCVAPQNFLARGLDPTIFGATAEVPQTEPWESRYLQFLCVRPSLTAFSGAGEGKTRELASLPCGELPTRGLRPRVCRFAIVKHTR